jgi:hypothetical protein
MKINKLFTVCKIFLFAFLLVSLDAKSLTSYQKIRNTYRSKIINITTDNLFDLALGMLNGFFKQKIEKTVKLAKMLKEGVVLTKDSLLKTLKDCVPQANKKFEDSKKTVNNEQDEFFATFISVISVPDRDSIMDKYINACKDNNTEDIKFYTEKQVNRLFSALKKIDNPDKEKQKKLLDDLQNKNKYFASIRSSNSICTYIKKNETWTSIVSRWTSYALDLSSCGAGKLATTFLANPTQFPNLFFSLFEAGLKAFYGFNYIKLGRIIWNTLRGLFYGETGYFIAGEALGREIGENVSITGIAGLRKLK